MSNLAPLAFDLETSGFDPQATLTVVGICSDVGAWQALNTAGRPADNTALAHGLTDSADRSVEVVVCQNEATLLDALHGFLTDRIDPQRHFICAYNGETWRGGFDLPFLRTACVHHDVDWPFAEFAYADVMAMVDRFNTGDAADLAGVYDALIGRDHGDPFDDSEAAVAAHEHGDWTTLLRHNLADVTRTLELAILAGRFVPKSDFKMKNLTPPDG